MMIGKEAIMFTFSQMQNLNELEMIVYNYVQENSKKIAKMTIRDLSENTVLWKK